ncbi:Outer membrane protein beta-barrel domain-containing protein [Lutibacter agarilyticus]|uniref:Outer membrane protein beta-barrel domain-containing protein n=1 Tax=Lutibacter agarilyticus TaxID=1109740 RepID=A0A238VMH4_9FLAO|nr:outer membrane beta-barrel protein [Lutibacter agarilyticus]SNR34689.1 Outer membrane protein beta-barrel domain-containing protein [Lutibacter agarilyticus]
MKKIIVCISFFLLISTHFTNAQTNNSFTKNKILTSKFQIGVGLFIPTQKVKFGLNAASKNQEIEFGDSFDFKNNSIRPQFYFDWRFSKNWKLSAEYFNANYNKKAVLDEDITINDGEFVFKKGSNVELGYKFGLYRVFVGRTISSGLKHELGGGLGFHITNIGPFIEGNIIVNDNDNEFKTASVSVTAPLPNVALWYYFAPTEKWSFTARLDWFGIKIDEFSGSLWDIGPSARYQLSKHFSVAVDYRYFKLNADIDKDFWNGSFDMSFNGPTLSVLANF